MAGQIGVVSLKGLYHEDSQYAFLGSGGMTSADVGKAVTIDTTANNTVKLAGDNDRILGRVEAVEVRTTESVTIVTVACAGGYEFMVNPDVTNSSPDESPNVVGDFLVGATTTTGTLKGYVQKSASNAPTKWQVVEVVSAAKVIAISL